MAEIAEVEGYVVVPNSIVPTSIPEPAHIPTVVAAEPERKVSPFKTRFQDAIWFDKLRESFILVLGSGGIGSWTIFALSRIGCPMLVFDMDLVEAHNLGGQLFNTEFVGKLKTEAIREICLKFSGTDTQISTDGKYTDDSGSNPIVIAAFDNMAARKSAFNQWEELLRETEEDGEDTSSFIFIDGRLLAEDYQVYAVTPDRTEDYRKTLFDDSEVEEVSCTLKSTTHCSMGIASEIISVLSNHMGNVALGEPMREVPFSISKSIQSYTYKTSDKYEE